jgi:hypothetical protein
VTAWTGGTGEEGRDKASATTFLGPGRWEKEMENSERKERWRCWREEKGVPDLLIVVTKGSWSVKSMNWHPLRKKRTWRTAR